MRPSLITALVIFAATFIVQPLAASPSTPGDCSRIFSVGNDYQLTWHRGDLSKPQISHYTVKRLGEEDVSFYRTNRKKEELNGYFPESAINKNYLISRRVLDLGTGDGQFVFELRDEGIEAYGIDLALNDVQKKSGFFIEGDAAKMPLSDASFDVVFSAHSLFDAEYIRYHSDEFLLQSLKEVARILRPGGEAYFGWADQKRLTPLLKLIPELEASFEPARPGQPITVLHIKRR